MPRPRVHDPDAILAAAEELLVERGRGPLTVRALTERSGASNGTVYHAFGSLETVVATAWLRRARQFLTLQRDAVEQAMAAGGPRRAVQAAADAPARLAEADLPAARLLVSLQRDDVLGDAVAPAVAVDLRALDAALAGTLRDLAQALWDRGDAAAVDVVTLCVVRLPAALLFDAIRAGQVPAHPRAQLAAAVGAVLDCGPTP
ncbi:TetR/AcrR family transcriptional regulator [Blastococcus sp. TF02A-26]|uniref:TetR/AcrR family transcriptional regulator n=1 Tax=Blastococcus sp. TF02A-26 TaxID=2250577 RepID=UPI000DEB09A8|nr:TetR/AcrR family transcriptional regulator [Blastococcus sp. TF02A-26]RBY89881.1 TetR/AcrR family transcriptional regulator [Blastococcus sp. TF02A-26]